MIVVSLRKYKKPIIAVVCLFVTSILATGIWHVKSSIEQAKADRSNAMQVTKAVSNEQSTPVISTDFFTEYRLERDKMRSERSDLLREAIRSAETEEIRNKAQENVLAMVKEKQRESEMESLIKARGFSDALVFYREHSVNAIVKAPVLSRDEVIQVADVISRVSGVKPEDITISAKP
ncbi:SpoIIIAH-like family protein [Dendrosporobacter sp. 1207_IL3150]|uniref:SpoIIIAH-like family protein n=1 Tax=Dendrosporobacter sp. 1207_IL3150 TaxID=3084054 RepID=UPI002FD8E1AE